MTTFHRAGASSPLSLPILAIAVSALTACVASTPSNQTLEAAEKAIAEAETVLVRDYPPAELGEARDNLSAARAAAKQDNMGLAAALARSSEANAKLAVAKAEAEKSRRMGEVQRGTDGAAQKLKPAPVDES